MEKWDRDHNELEYTGVMNPPAWSDWPGKYSFCITGICLYSYLHPAKALEALLGPAVDVISSSVSTTSADGIHSPSTYYKLTFR